MQRSEIYNKKNSVEGFDLRVQPIVPVVGGCYYYSTGSGITGGLKSNHFAGS